MIEKLKITMIEYFQNDKRRINHFLKVHSIAKLIGVNEKLNSKELFILEVAAITHDIGIKRAEQLYNSSAGSYQQELGPEDAEKMLCGLGFDNAVVTRVKYLISKHHTYSNIEGADLQILIEADFIVNLDEENSNSDAVRAAYKNIFKTQTGKMLAKTMFKF